MRALHLGKDVDHAWRSEAVFAFAALQHQQEDANGDESIVNPGFAAPVGCTCRPCSCHPGRDWLAMSGLPRVSGGCCIMRGQLWVKVACH